VGVPSEAAGDHVGGHSGGAGIGLGVARVRANTHAIGKERRDSQDVLIRVSRRGEAGEEGLEGEAADGGRAGLGSTPGDVGSDGWMCCDVCCVW
jgi:hypothetical protein